VITTICEAHNANHLRWAFRICGLETLRNTAKNFGSKLSSKFEVCKDFAIANVRPNHSTSFSQDTVTF
jgi:hypothetical protein